jgi:hypothetical protein
MSGTPATARTGRATDRGDPPRPHAFTPVAIPRPRSVVRVLHTRSRSTKEGAMRGSFKFHSFFGGVFFGTWALFSVARDAIRERLTRG